MKEFCFVSRDFKVNIPFQQEFVHWQTMISYKKRKPAFISLKNISIYTYMIIQNHLNHIQERSLLKIAFNNGDCTRQQESNIRPIKNHIEFNSVIHPFTNQFGIFLFFHSKYLSGFTLIHWYF